MGAARAPARRAEVKGFLLTLLATAIAFVVLVQLLPPSIMDMTGDLVPQLVVGALIGLVNAIVKPIVKLLSLPLTLMTLGLWSFVVNALMLLLSAWIAQTFLDLDFTVGGWPASGFSLDTIVGAVVGSIVLSILTSLVGRVVHD
jgi:putative membrane protein